MKVLPKYHYNIRNKENPAIDYNQIEIDVTPSDKIRLERFFKEEANYYNRLVDGFSSMVRSFPELIAELSDQWIKIFGFVAETRTNLRPFYDLKDTQVKLPPLLEIYKTQLSELTERHILLTELAAVPGILLPIVRRNMATEILKFYQEQARRILTPGSSKMSDDGDVYKVPPEMLEQVDYDRKRHVQIPKTGLQISWNAINEATELRCGYVGHPIVLPKINLLTKSNWNFAIIRQQPGSYVEPSTPWVMDIRKLPVGYLLKHFDGRLNSNRRLFQDAKSN